MNKEDKDKIKRIKRSRDGLEKAHKRLIKNKAFRIWVETNTKVHLLNYPYYRIKDRKKIKEIMNGLS